MIECRGEQLHREYQEYFGKFNKKNGKMMAQNKFAINKRFLVPDCTSTERRNFAHSGREKVRLFKGSKETHWHLNVLTFVYSAKLLSRPKIALSIALAF